MDSLGAEYMFSDNKEGSLTGNNEYLTEEERIQKKQREYM
jgi:hypothetical protein